MNDKDFDWSVRAVVATSDNESIMWALQEDD